MAINLCNSKEEGKAKTFKEYKRFVAKVAQEHGKGWELDIDDIAKYPGDFILEYKYLITKNFLREKYIWASLPPISARYYNEDDNILDGRVQMNKKELFLWLNKCEEEFLNYATKNKLVNVK